MKHPQTQSKPEDLTLETLLRPYEQRIFITQLIAAGVPQASIDQMLTRPNSEDLLAWLYGDIEQNEARIIGGERQTRVVGVIITAGRQVLLERDPDLGPDRLFAFGGQVRFDEDPAVAARREIQEETSLIATPEQLMLLSQSQALGSESMKLPGVPARREITQFLVRVAAFADIPGQRSGIHRGSDGQRHELLLLRIEDALIDMRIQPAYRSALAAAMDQIRS